MKNRGTDQAALLVRCFLDRARSMKYSYSFIFVDLAAAFDTAIRECILGWTGPKPSDPEASLRQLGLSQEAAAIIVNEIEAANGSMLYDLNMDADTVAMIRSVHHGTWFALPNQSKLLRTAKGGRQGCPLGALIFNLW